MLAYVAGQAVDPVDTEHVVIEVTHALGPPAT